MHTLDFDKILHFPLSSHYICFLGDQIDEATAIVNGYNAFFSFSKVKGGYSGEFFN